MMCQSTGLSPISIIGFGFTCVSSLRREPYPPARITAFIAGHPLRGLKMSYFDRDSLVRTAICHAVGFSVNMQYRVSADGGANSHPRPALDRTSTLGDARLGREPLNSQFS